MYPLYDYWLPDYDYIIEITEHVYLEQRFAKRAYNSTNI